MTTSQAVRAIDVGFGNTKFVLNPAASGIQCSLFPSLAPLATNDDLTGGVLQKRNTVIVEVNGQHYEVGRDAVIAQGANPSRILDPSFAKSDAYIALIRGALYYMGVSQIDNLIVGLPVSTYRDLSQGLTQTLTGKHTIPNAARNGLQEVQVNCVHALPQPLGAFFDHVYTENNFQELRSRLCLVVAPGFFTLDWRVNAVMTFS